jgi:hypothetical protein
MNTKAWIATISGSLLIACSSAPNAGFNQAGGEDAAGGGSSGGAGSSGGGSSGGAATSSGAGGGSSGSSVTSTSSSGAGGSSGGGSSSGGAHDGGGNGINWGTQIPSSELGTPVTLTAASFQVAPGAEVYKCQVFANPFAGVTTDIVKMHGVMSAGSHHFFLFNISGAEAVVEPPQGTIGDCAGKGLEFHPFPFLSQQADWSVGYPTAADGSPMGYPLVGQNLLMINVHYLNTSSAPINAQVTITLTPAKPGVVKTHVGTIFLNNTTASVPASVPMTSPIHTTMTWVGDATLPATYSIFTSWQHMHRTALKFTATTNGNTFYTDTNWDSPNLYIHAANMTEPPTATGLRNAIPMTNSQSITWDCSYYNDQAVALTFGDSALSNIMCIYLGQYYPASPTAPDIVYVLN